MNKQKKRLRNYNKVKLKDQWKTLLLKSKGKYRSLKKKKKVYMED